MKIHKLVCVDSTDVEELKSQSITNFSGFVQQLIKDYIQATHNPYKGMSRSQLNKEEAKALAQQQYEKELEAIEAKQW